MIFYQLHNRKTDLWFKRDRSVGWCSDQQKASVWSTPAGPRAAIGAVTRYNRMVAHSHPGRMIRPGDLQVVIIIAGGQAAFVRGDDWEGLYLQGKLVEEGHRVRMEEIFRHLGVQVEFIEADEAWLCERGRLPEDLKDVKKL